MTSGSELLDELLPRCSFPESGERATVALSGGPDSAALLALAVHHGLRVEAVHVDHGLRPDASLDARRSTVIAERLGAACRVVRVDLVDGPNLEARARAARRAAVGDAAMTGHTADDQAETLLLSLLRGAGATGLGAIRPGPAHPILGLRRSETQALCTALGLEVVDDPSNRDARFRRNRVRHEVLPLLDDVAERDVTTLIARTADLLRADDDLLGELSRAIDPTDVAALRAAPLPLARRALRRWLHLDGYAPDAASIDRVLAVAHHEAVACELSGGRRVSRSAGRLRVDDAGPG